MMKMFYKLWDKLFETFDVFLWSLGHYNYVVQLFMVILVVVPLALVGYDKYFRRNLQQELLANMCYLYGYFLVFQASGSAEVVAQLNGGFSVVWLMLVVFGSLSMRWNGAYLGKRLAWVTFLVLLQMVVSSSYVPEVLVQNLDIVANYKARLEGHPERDNPFLWVVLQQLSQSLPQNPWYCMFYALPGLSALQYGIMPCSVIPTKFQIHKCTEIAGSLSKAVVVPSEQLKILRELSPAFGHPSSWPADVVMGPYQDLWMKKVELQKFYNPLLKNMQQESAQLSIDQMRNINVMFAKVSYTDPVATMAKNYPEFFAILGEENTRKLWGVVTKDSYIRSFNLNKRDQLMLFYDRSPLGSLFKSVEGVKIWGRQWGQVVNLADVRQSSVQLFPTPFDCAYMDESGSLWIIELKDTYVLPDFYKEEVIATYTQLFDRVIAGGFKLLQVRINCPDMEEILKNKESCEKAFSRMVDDCNMDLYVELKIQCYVEDLD